MARARLARTPRASQKARQNRRPRRNRNRKPSLRLTRKPRPNRLLRRQPSKPIARGTLGRNMRKLLGCLLVLASLAAAAPKKPKLVLAIVIDQFRYDYLTRFRSDYT